ncbi:putative holin-like toxin [Lederbergia sp. NSJ-179]|uniref:putative holin-like toxin n=1 Tax=Lederbergia sp. NSJ-179 TaxID=2931402 RepID=UPI001FD2BE69|nr:putative holin-like toxin [Lederbergia sp. NSJ-179]MCJ7840263.1 putative holin-like toxin [Lederbergia sp. NSJ-179]
MMTVFEGLMLAIAFASLILAILSFEVMNERLKARRQSPRRSDPQSCGTPPLRLGNNRADYSLNADRLRAILLQAVRRSQPRMVFFNIFHLQCLAL